MSGWLLRPWRLAVAGIAAVVLLAASIHFTSERHSSGPMTAGVQEEPAEVSDYELIAKLDDALASENNSIWIDSPAY